MESDLGLYHYVLLVLGGLAAGLINTLAGNGSAITLSLMMFMGLPAGAANATNRIGVVFQTITAVMSLPKTPAVKTLKKRSLYLFIPAAIGAAIGAWLADETPDIWLRYIIGLVMILLLATLLFKPSRWLKATISEPKQKGAGMYGFFFSIGLYAGYIQMGIGIMMLAVLVLYAGYSLVDANVIKLVMALVFTIPAFFVFLAAGKMHWPMGIALGIGQMAGAWMGTRFLLPHPEASRWIRFVLIVILVYAIFRIFGLHTLFAFR